MFKIGPPSWLSVLKLQKIILNSTQKVANRCSYQAWLTCQIDFESKKKLKGREGFPKFANGLNIIIGIVQKVYE